MSTPRVRCWRHRSERDSICPQGCHSPWGRADTHSHRGAHEKQRAQKTGGRSMVLQALHAKLRSWSLFCGWWGALLGERRVDFVLGALPLVAEAGGSGVGGTQTQSPLVGWSAVREWRPRWIPGLTRGALNRTADRLGGRSIGFSSHNRVEVMLSATLSLATEPTKIVGCSWQSWLPLGYFSVPSFLIKFYPITRKNYK